MAAHKMDEAPPKLPTPARMYLVEVKSDIAETSETVHADNKTNALLRVLHAHESPDRDFKAPRDTRVVDSKRVKATVSQVVHGCAQRPTRFDAQVWIVLGKHGVLSRSVNHAFVREVVE